jgi:WD40 repeat protein
MNRHKLFILLALFFYCTNLLAIELHSPLLPQGELFQNFEILLENVIPRKPISAIAFSPSGEVLALSIVDTVYLWDIQSGKIVKRLGSPENQDNQTLMINSLAFSLADQFLAIGYDDFVQIWNIKSGKPIQQLEKQKSNMTAITFSPKDSKILALGSMEGTVYLWNWSINKIVKQLPGHSASVNTLAFNSNGQRLASGGSDALIYLWKLSSDEKQQLKGHLDVVTQVQFDSNDEYLASASWDKTVRLWNIKSDKPSKPDILEGHSAAVNTLAFSPDGKTLVSGAMDNSIRLWDIQLKTEMKERSIHSNHNVIAVAFSPNGQFFASASWDKTVRLWDVQSAQEFQRQEFQRQEFQLFEGHASPVNIIAFDSEGKTLISGSDDHGITVWHGQDLSSNPNFTNGISYLTKEVRSINSFALSPDGQFLAFGTKEGRIHFLERQTGQKIKHLPALSKEEVNVVAFSPDGKILASGSRYSTEPQNSSPLHLWDVPSGKKIKALKGHTNHVFALAFSPNGQILASGSDDKTIQLWEIPSGEKMKVLKGHDHFITSLAFHSEGNMLASGSWDKTVRLWDVELGKEIKRLEGHSHYVTAVSFSPKGKILASSAWDKTIRLWDSKFGLQLHRLKAHTDFVHTIAFNQTGELLASGSKDSTIRLWDVNTGQLQQVMITGSRHTWANCQVSTQYCWRADDGTLLIDKKGNGTIQSILPPVKKAKPPKIKFSSDSLKLNYGEPSSLSLTISNQDTVPIYWINVRALFEKENPLIFYPPETHLVLKANESITLPIKINAWLDDENRQSQKTELKLSLRAANHHDQLITIPVRILVSYTFSWQLYIVLSLLVLFISIILYYLSLYYHPIVQRLSADSRQLFALPLEQLPKAKQLLQKTRLLDMVLSNNDSHHKWLDEAIGFLNQPNQLRCQLLANRLNASIQSHAHDELFILQLSTTFPLKLDKLAIYFPPAHSPVQEIIWRLKQDDINFQTTLVISLETTTNLRTYGKDRTNLWIIPDSRELTNLLLSPVPIDVLTRLLATQLAIITLSPYQTRGGITKSSLFFGRDKILAQILNREPKNYLVIGGRQVGKTSLLHQIKRHYQNHPKVECVYLSVSRSDRKVFTEHLSNLPKERQRLLLIDEADVFIRREMVEDYPTLSHFRNLSEAGQCYFILAGFWDLYDAAVLDYHSPIKNFGEAITIGALELEACWKLAIEPMKMLGIDYAQEELVEQIIIKTGQRANLMATVCDEMLKNLPAEAQVLTKKESINALNNPAIAEALGYSMHTSSALE